MSSGGPYPATFDRHSSSISHFPLQGFSFSCSPASPFSSAAVTAHGSRPSAEGEFQHNSFSLAGEAQPLPVVELQSSWGTSNRLAMPFLLAAEEPASSPTRRPSSSSSSFSSPPHTTPTVGPNNHVHAAHQSEYAMPTIPVIPITLTDDEIGSRSERRGGALDQRLASVLPSTLPSFPSLTVVPAVLLLSLFRLLLILLLLRWLLQSFCHRGARLRVSSLLP